MGVLDMADEAHVVDTLRVRFALHRGAVGEEGHVVLRRDVAGKAVGHVHVLAAILIEVRNERAPAPVGFGGAREVAHVAEGAVAVVALQHVAHELVMVPVTHLRHVHVPPLVHGRRLDAVFVLRHHVGGVHVGPAVVVHVGDVHAHGEVARHGHGRVEHVTERPVLLVEVQVVPLVEVVGHVNVGPPVAIHVGHADTEAEGDLRTPDAGLARDIGEVVAVVAIEVVAAVRVPLIARVAHAEAVHRARRVVDHEQIEITVAIEVEERRVRGPAFVGHAILARHFLEGGHRIGVEPLIDPQGVGTGGRLAVAGMTDVNVELPSPFTSAIVTPVVHGFAFFEPRRRRDVAEAEAPLVQVQRGPS
jgi:hypothetical protein